MNEAIILAAADRIADAVTREHFHNKGLMDDQVPGIQWSGYYDMVRDKILDVSSKYSD